MLESRPETVEPATDGPQPKAGESSQSGLSIPLGGEVANDGRPSLTSSDANDAKGKENGDAAFNNRHLRFLFVAYLFSATIGAIGTAVDRIVSADPLLWPAITHLGVAFFATSVSFVHWAATINEKTDQLRNIFSRQYFLLLLDLVLVILYLSLVGRVDTVDAVSAAPEAVRLAIMYCLYAFWDFCHDVWGRMKGANIWQLACAMLLRCGTSLLCAGVSYFIYWRASWPIPPTSLHLQVCLLNLAEVFNIVLFRALKALEWPLERRMPAKHLAGSHRENGDRYSTWRPTMQGAIAVCSAGLVVIFSVFVGISAVGH